MANLTSAHDDYSRSLLRAVPDSARRILSVNCDERGIGEAVKQIRPGSRVFATTPKPTAVWPDPSGLDRLFRLDVETELPPLETGSLDCILFGSVLDRSHDPEAVLRRYGTLLEPGGVILGAIANA